MIQSPLSRLGAAAAVAFAALAVASPSQAGVRHQARSVQGPFGRGYSAERTVHRSPGQTTAVRSVQTDHGYGFTTRDTHYGPGQVSNQVTRTYNDGASVSRTVNREPGSASVERTHTGVDGRTQSGWDTVYRTDDGYTRTRGVSTSSGRSLTATEDVSVSDSAITVEHTLTTGSGSSVTHTNVIGRR